MFPSKRSAYDLTMNHNRAGRKKGFRANYIPRANRANKPAVRCPSLLAHILMPISRIHGRVSACIICSLVEGIALKAGKSKAIACRQAAGAAARRVLHERQTDDMAGDRSRRPRTEPRLPPR